MRSAILWKAMGEELGEMETESDRWGVAVHEAAHAVASHHLRPEAPIQYASVIKRDKGTGGFVSSIDEHDIYKRRERLIADTQVALASVWSEKHFFAENLSIGPGSDLEKATKWVSAMVTQLAMGSTVMVWGKDETIPMDIQEEIRDTLHVYYDEMAELMYEKRDQVEIIAQLLQKHGTVDGIEIHELIERMES
jgi:ATP-dependent Zn protease